MKILFVCLGNICRSPAGENILRHTALTANVSSQFEIDSAGTEAWHTGKSPDARMTQTLLARDIPVTGYARQITTQDLKYFDLILTMDNENFENVRQLDSTGAFSRKIQKFTRYCRNHSETEVPNPYYGGQDGFDLVADLLTDGCQELVKCHTR